MLHVDPVMILRNTVRCTVPNAHTRVELGFRELHAQCFSMQKAGTDKGRIVFKTVLRELYWKER